MMSYPPPLDSVPMPGGGAVHQQQQPLVMHHLDTNNLESRANENAGVNVMTEQDVRNVMNEVVGGGCGVGVSRVCK